MTTPTIDRSACIAPRHGRYWMYDKYRCRCPDAVREKTNRARRQRAGTLPPGYVDATGTRRRLQALAVEGWPVNQLADLTGLSERCLRYALNSRIRVNAVTARYVAAVYDRLAGGIGDDKSTVTRAIRRGWVGSDRWTSARIDDPTCEPLPAATTNVVDEVLVARVLDGRADAARLNRAERAAAARLGQQRGMTTKALTEMLHMKATTLARITKEEFLDVPDAVVTCGSDHPKASAPHVRLTGREEAA